MSRALGVAVAVAFLLSIATLSCGSSGGGGLPQTADASADACAAGSCIADAADSGPSADDGAAPEVGADARSDVRADVRTDGASETATCQQTSACSFPTMVFDSARCECVPRPATSCTQTIDAFCAADGGALPRCVRTWSPTPDPAQWCRSPNDHFYYYAQCDGFNLVVHMLVDTAVVFYYDPVTSQLVRVENTNFVNAGCNAGVPGLVVLQSDCSSPGTIPCQ